MDFQPDMLEVLACPQCQGELRLTKENLLVCLPCKVYYPIEDGVAKLGLHEGAELSRLSRIKKTINTYLTVELGDPQGFSFHLEPYSYRILGRQNPTSFSDDPQLYRPILLDKQSSQIISGCLRKLARSQKRDEWIDSLQNTTLSLDRYQRLSDVFFSDAEMSRVHAFIFCDETHAGIVDLVSQSGTFLNDVELEMALFDDKDLIRLGRTLLRVQKK